MAIRKLEQSFGVDQWKQLLEEGGRLRLSLTTKDMMPAVLPNDIVEFEEARLMQVRNGDLVLLYSKGSLRLRRVQSRLISQGGEIFVLAADNVPASQEEHGFEEILAKVISIEREGEVLRPRRDSVLNAKLRRKFKNGLKYCWHSFLLWISPKHR